MNGHDNEQPERGSTVSAANRVEGQPETRIGSSSADWRGPGKAASRLNAVEHGLLSKTPILPGEDDAQRAALHERMVEDLAPVGAFEEELVAKIASAMSAMRRFERSRRRCTPTDCSKTAGKTGSRPPSRS